MEKERVIDWMLDWFKKNSIATAEIKPSSAYLEKALIDSFLFIQLLADIEEKYHVELSSDQFEDGDFSTIEGLANIIERSL